MGKKSHTSTPPSRQGSISKNHKAALRRNPCPMGWMVQGRWWRPERRFLPIKNHGCFFGGPSSAHFGSWSLSLFNFFEVNRFIFQKEERIPMTCPGYWGWFYPHQKRSFKSVCMFSESSKNHHKPFNPNPNWRTTAINMKETPNKFYFLTTLPSPCHLQASPLEFCRIQILPFQHPNESQIPFPTCGNGWPGVILNGKML